MVEWGEKGGPPAMPRTLLKVFSSGSGGLETQLNRSFEEFLMFLCHLGLLVHETKETGK